MCVPSILNQCIMLWHKNDVLVWPANQRPKNTKPRQRKSRRMLISMKRAIFNSACSVWPTDRRYWSPVENSSRSGLDDTNKSVILDWYGDGVPNDLSNSDQKKSIWFGSSFIDLHGNPLEIDQDKSIDHAVTANQAEIRLAFQRADIIGLRPKAPALLYDIRSEIQDDVIEVNLEAKAITSAHICQSEPI